jgi:two-component system, OmpR family, response regulator CpxR
VGEVFTIQATDWLINSPCENERVMPRVLIIDDDRDLTAMLAEYLSPEGFVVETAHSGEDGLAAALATSYSLVILDVMLPRINGLEVLRRFRARSACPVIMLTARGQDVDRIVGLEIGADDYLAKPFNARELLARMHAVLRRSQASLAAAASAAATAGGGAGAGAGAFGTPGAPGTGGAGAGDGVLAVGDVVMDVRARTVRRGSELVELTSLEFELLKVLMTAAGDVVSRETLFEQVLRREYNVFDRSIDNHVSSLRKKLGPRVGDAERIRSIRNAGYAYARTTPGTPHPSPLPASGAREPASPRPFEGRGQGEGSQSGDR